MPTNEELQDGFKIGDWEVLPAQGVLRCGDREETPEPLVFKLLMALATRDGNVASKDDLVTVNENASQDEVLTVGRHAVRYWEPLEVRQHGRLDSNLR